MSGSSNKVVSISARKATLKRKVRRHLQAAGFQRSEEGSLWIDDGYQLPKDYWEEVMQDDVYLTAADNCGETAEPHGITEDRPANTIGIKLGMMQQLLAGWVRLVTN